MLDSETKQICGPQTLTIWNLFQKGKAAITTTPPSPASTPISISSWPSIIIYSNVHNVLLSPQIPLILSEKVTHQTTHQVHTAFRSIKSCDFTTNCTFYHAFHHTQDANIFNIVYFICFALMSMLHKLLEGREI